MDFKPKRHHSSPFVSPPLPSWGHFFFFFLFFFWLRDALNDNEGLFGVYVCRVAWVKEIRRGGCTHLHTCPLTHTNIHIVHVSRTWRPQPTKSKGSRLIITEFFFSFFFSFVVCVICIDPKVNTHIVYFPANFCCLASLFFEHFRASVSNRVK